MRPLKRVGLALAAAGLLLLPGGVARAQSRAIEPPPSFDQPRANSSMEQPFATGMNGGGGAYSGAPRIKPAEGQGALPPIVRDAGIDQRLNDQVPLDLPFLDETGRAVHLADYVGQRPVVLALVYYECPMLCTQVLNGLTACLKTLKFDAGKDYEVVVVSFNPKDTFELAAAKKANYLQGLGRAGAEAGWHFLTGEQAPILRLANSVGFRYVWDDASKQFVHASAIMLLTPQGKVSRYFYGVDYPPKDVRLGLIEASQNRIGTVVDQVLLYCYHYDPATGKYGVAAMNILRISGVLTVLGIVSFVLLSLRFDPARRKEALATATTHSSGQIG